MDAERPFELNLFIACRISMTFSFFPLTALCDPFQVYVLVTVQPEGVVVKPNVPERELALYNIGTVLVFLYNSFRSSLINSENKLVKHGRNFSKSIMSCVNLFAFLCKTIG